MKSMDYRMALAVAAMGVCVALVAAPQLKSQPEVVADGEFRAKVLALSEGVPAPTPESRIVHTTRGTESKELRIYAPADLWRLRALAGEWKDRRGNVMRILRVKSCLPTVESPSFGGMAEKERIEAALDAAEKAFSGTDADREAWRRDYGPQGEGRFFEVKGKTYFVEFVFAETVKPKEAEQLLKAFERSVSARTSVTGAQSSMKWWETTNESYRFLTDLDPARGKDFVKKAMTLAGAMRKLYEFYIPPSHPVGVGVVRVFKTLQGYRDYRASTGDDDQMSCGLWDPMREELLIVAENREQALATMRHEAFHQYLFYATGNGHHATWFNEGHACFFEEVQYNGAMGTAKVVENKSRSAWVDRNPAAVAAHFRRVTQLTHAEFYSGEVNLNYVSAWALVYFLEKGAYTSEEFAPYRAVVPKYLELTAGGTPGDEAGAQALELVKDRDLAADFLKFWREKRRVAEKVRQTNDSKSKRKDHSR